MNEQKVRKFRKKAVVIEAIKWTGENLREVIDFIGLHESIDSTWEEYKQLVEEKGLKIFTLEGTMMASHGDMIIKGVSGEFYPCKPDIFEKTYEPVENEEDHNPVKKDLAISDSHEARKNISDLKTFGNPDQFSLLCKASSESQGWMKSTKVCNVPGGCVVQVTTQQMNPDGSYSVAEALTYVPGVQMAKRNDELFPSLIENPFMKGNSLGNDLETDPA